ncbi:MAG: LysR family transcriptional regulator [Streptosporangiales bacterium]|nr:LysR family transcriptional regulator [Streptosporangiales bacterium]
MDFDLAQVRAFVAVAEQRHFSRAAAGLHLTQQALSRRIQRLEQLLGTPLFVRNSGGVELTPAGQRLLPYARQLLAVAESAEAEARSASGPLRVDVWGIHALAPLRFVEHLTATQPSLQIEPSMRRSVWAAMEALLRGELDVAFGRVHDLGRPWPPALRRRIAQLEPAAVLTSLDHPLSTGPTIRPAELTDSVMWGPPSTTAPEMRRWVERFAQAFEIPLRYRAIGTILDLNARVEQVREHPTHVFLLPVEAAIPDDGVRLVPLTDPVLRYPWSVIWRRDDLNPSLARFLRHLSEMGRAEDWTGYDPVRDWTPEPDRADL